MKVKLPEPVAADVCLGTRLITAPYARLGPSPARASDEWGASHRG
jgi:hypothetical protein